MAITVNYVSSATGLLNLGGIVTASDQAPEIAPLLNGNWATVFNHSGPSGQGVASVVRSGSDDALLAATGELSSTTVGLQGDARLAAVSTGFVALWEDSSGDVPTLRYRQFSNNGVPLGEEVDVRSRFHPITADIPITASILNGDIARLTNGNLVIAFECEFSATDHDIHALVMTSTGSTFMLRNVEAQALNAVNPRVVALSNGNFMVAWEQTSGLNTSVYRAIYGPTGTLVMAPQVFDNVGSINRDVALAATADGGYIASHLDNAWPSPSVTLGRYDSFGQLVGEVRVDVTAGAELSSSVAVLPNQWIAVAVVAEGAAAGTQTAHLRLFDASLVPVSVPGVTDAVLSSAAARVDVASLLNGRLVVAIETTTGLPDNSLSYFGLDLVRNSVGDSANDIIAGDAMRDSISGGAGADFIIGGAGADTIDAGSGFDAVSWFSGTVPAQGAVLNLTNQSLNSGTALGDVVVGAEVFYLTQAADHFTNTNELAYVYAFGGNDTVVGGSATEFIDAGTGADFIDAGGGFDYVSYASSAVPVGLNLATAVHTLGALGDVFVGAEAFYLSAYADIYTGQAGQNYVFSGAGADTLIGGNAASDWLFGEAGDDFISGGDFNDLLSGGEGADTYFVRNFANNGFDSILTFTSGQDRILIDPSSSGLSAGHALTAGVDFITAASPFATSAMPSFLYATGLGILYFDPDGSGAMAPVPLFQISGAPALQAGDVVVGPGPG